MKMKLIYFLVTILFTACIKPDKKKNEEAPILDRNEKIIIANEGGFGKGNAELSYINPISNEINNELYKKANNNAVLGDILQSISFKNGLAYCVLNNSGTIKILDLSNFTIKGTITNLNQPRYMSHINSNMAIVSTLSLNQTSVYNPLSIINTETFTKSSTINMYGWTEGLLSIGTSTYICNYYKGTLYQLNNATLQIEDSVQLDYGCSEVIASKNGQILVLCNGNYSNSNSVAKVFLLDTNNLNTIKSITFNTSGYSQLTYVTEEDVLLILGENKIHKIDLITSSVSPFITALPNETFYGFAYDVKYKKYYVCDAKDYQQRGQVIVMDKNGNRLSALMAGFVPSKVYFNYK
jgi:hypothetical protein